MSTALIFHSLCFPNAHNLNACSGTILYNSYGFCYTRIPNVSHITPMSPHSECKLYRYVVTFILFLMTKFCQNTHKDKTKHTVNKNKKKQQQQQQ